MSLFKNWALTSLKHNSTSHSHQLSNKTERIISLREDQTEVLQEQLRSKDEIMNFIIRKFPRN